MANARNVLFPSELPGIERVLCAKLLGVWLQADMGMKKHVEYIVHICNQRTYLLTQLKRRGLPPAQLQNVFDTIILARVLYALPAWRGYMNASDINRLRHLFLKAQRWQLTTTNYDATKLFENCDVALFKSSINVNHYLRHLYPEK